MSETKRQLDEQLEEARAGVADGLKAGARFADIMREAAAYGIKPEEVAEIRDEVEMKEEHRAAAIIAEMTSDERAEGFHALLGSDKNGGYQLEDADGTSRPWSDLSPAGKLGAVTRVAAYYDVPFEAFAATARENVGSDALLDASLRVAFDNQREITAAERVLPDDGRTEPTSLVDRVKDVFADLAHAEAFIRRQQEQERER